MSYDIDLLTQAHHALNQGELEQALQLTQSFLHDAQEQHEHELGLRLLAKLHFKLRDLSPAIKTLEKLTSLLSRSKNKHDYLIAQQFLARCYEEDTRYQESMLAWLEVGSVGASVGDEDAFVEALIGIAVLLEVVNDHKRAMRFYNKAQSHREGITSAPLKLRLNLCQAACLIFLEQYPEASELLDRTEQEAVKAGVVDAGYRAEFYLYHARICRAQSKLDIAANLLVKAQHHSQLAGYVWVSNKVQFEKCVVSTLSGKHDPAIEQLQASLEQVQQANLPILESEIYDALSLAFGNKGDFQSALECEKKAHAIEVELLKKVPISELGQNCFRRFKRWEPELETEKTKLENLALKTKTQSQKAMVNRLERDVYIDPLTRIHNRRWLDITLAEKQKSYALLLIDVDHFKGVNDNYSHQIGDQVLQCLASIFSHNIRQDDAVARYGGEEFVVLLAVSDKAQALETAERLRLAVQNYDWADLVPGRNITISAGAASKADQDTVSDLLNRADRALYSAKHSGRNQVQYQ
ncbi:GGDEF domain-containing protein [Motilimonas pumila]|uniref:GGDEF domain-containing protein n=1 Tax=Motilimonas pumila TaxID=2303987 RepID=UPI00131470F4|nr:GGDEF domain-containing protein [Motilimonas pumila]